MKKRIAIGLLCLMGLIIAFVVLLFIKTNSDIFNIFKSKSNGHTGYIPGEPGDYNFGHKNLPIERISLNDSKERLGGSCSYDEFPGKCKITSIQKTPESINQIKVTGGPGYEGYDIAYSYTAIKEPSDRRLIPSKSEFYHLSFGSLYIGPEFIKKYNIKVDNIYDCNLQLITKESSGGCSPAGMIFTDRSIDLRDFFEFKRDDPAKSEVPIVNNTGNNLANSNLSNSVSPVDSGFINEPISNAKSRIIAKPFGIEVAPSKPPMTPEKFSGFHTGTDFEIIPPEIDSDVKIFAVCKGQLKFKESASGYGGVAVQQCKINNADTTIIYGHLKLDSITAKIDQELNPGEQIGILGKGYSTETDGERKHLHLGVHKGITINLLGYVQNESLLDGWIDPMTLLK